MSCGVGHRQSLDLVLLWLWHRLAVVALIRPLAWELPYAMGVALKKKKERKKEIHLGLLDYFSSLILTSTNSPNQRTVIKKELQIPPLKMGQGMDSPFCLLKALF